MSQHGFRRGKMLTVPLMVVAILLLAGCGSGSEKASGAKEAQGAADTQTASGGREYEGEGRMWTAQYAMYMPEQGGKLRARLTAHYEGSGPAPTGEVKYSYYGVDVESGSGGLMVKHPPANSVYLLRDLVTTEYAPDEAGTVELLLMWDGGKRSETIRLLPTEAQQDS
ncbi:hypothetical protein B9G55_17025 [Saccharibacillus sp. O16]|nr:hypothetical protein B9G55_17025 [Saccharibacillus sp. O16]